MKLLLVIIRDEDSFNILDSLIDEGFMVTKISSTGGFLKQGNTTLLLGINEDRLETAIKIINNNLQGSKYVSFHGYTEINADLTIMRPIELPSGATIFIMNVERFEKY